MRFVPGSLAAAPARVSSPLPTDPFDMSDAADPRPGAAELAGLRVSWRKG
jgi:hypothetical protein